MTVGDKVVLMKEDEPLYGQVLIIDCITNNHAVVNFEGKQYLFKLTDLKLLVKQTGT